MRKIGIFHLAIMGLSIGFSSAFFFLIWNILGTPVFGFPPIGLSGILAVNLLCAPLELMVMGSILHAFLQSADRGTVPKKSE